MRPREPPASSPARCATGYMCPAAGAGWAGGGLTDAECSMVQRFDPSTASGEATIGFFVARLERVP